MPLVAYVIGDCGDEASYDDEEERD